MSQHTSHASSRAKNEQQKNGFLRNNMWSACEGHEKGHIKEIRVFDSEDGQNSNWYAKISGTMVYRLTPEGRKLFETVQREFEETKKTSLSRKNKKKSASHNKNKNQVRTLSLGSTQDIFEDGNLAPEFQAAVTSYRKRRRNNWNPS